MFLNKLTTQSHIYTAVYCVRAVRLTNQQTMGSNGLFSPEACLCVPGSLCPGFYVFATFMQLFFATFCKCVATVENFFCNFLQLFSNFFAYFLASLSFSNLFCNFCNKKLQRSCKKLPKKSCKKSYNFFGQNKLQNSCEKQLRKSCPKNVAYKLQQSCKKLQKKLHKSYKHREPGTQ